MVRQKVWWIHEYVLEDAPKKDHMISPMNQNNIVTAYNIKIVKTILEELNGEYIALLVDKSLDMSCKEKIKNLVFQEFVILVGDLVINHLAILFLC